MTTLERFIQDAYTHRTIPVMESFYTDTLTPIHMFQAMKEEAVYILESQDPESPWSNYSFIGMDPMLKIEQQSGLFVICDFDKKVKKQYQTLQQAFDAAFETLAVKEPDIPVPFRGGAVGYIGYDSISDFEPVEPRHTEATKLSNYHFLFCRTLIAYDHRTKETTLLTFARMNGNESRQQQIRHFETSIQRLTMMKEQLNKAGNTHDLMLPLQSDESKMVPMESNYTKERFIEHVGKIKEYIHAGDIFQAVLSQRFEKETTLDGFQLYRVLRKVNPSPYLFYLNFSGVEVVGSSPERLLQVQDGKLEIHPIAGTRKRGSTTEEDDRLATELLADEKEQAEHRMLVDLARNDIGKVAAYGSVAVPEYMVIGRFSKVMHIISKVTGKLREGIHPITALQAAFPAGTLSGAPKVRAMQILRELEPTPRHLYGGGIVYVGFDGNIDSCITIRTMTLHEGKVWIQAGAGVVADSDPEKEYEETINKASALKEAITIAERVFESSREGVEQI
ncbi:anthranilate synthase component I [Thalassobacillus hwangdonensis]|uniref:Anthranilate synthase component 1 n=1 Tax=Thalassobacillus hwangdonensis TaxID=546108 RepID=A0ABW3L4H1_9BACI